MTIEIWGKESCPYCTKAKILAETMGLDFTYKELGKDFDREEILERFPGARTFPQIIVDGNAVGGFDQFAQYLKEAA
jgi:glutaredoxin 3